MAARVVIESEGEVVAEGKVLAAAKITKDMPVIVKYDPLPSRTVAETMINSVYTFKGSVNIKESKKFVSVGSHSLVC